MVTQAVCRPCQDEHDVIRRTWTDVEEIAYIVDEREVEEVGLEPAHGVDIGDVNNTDNVLIAIQLLPTQ